MYSKDKQYKELASRIIVSNLHKNTDDKCYLLSSKPKDEFSEYSEHRTWVTKDTFLSLKEESYDKDGEKLKYKELTYTKIDNYYIMNTLNVKNIQKNTSTFLTINDIKVNKYLI